MPANLVVHPTEAELLTGLAAKLSAAASSAIAERGVFSLALSGGSTPKAFYKLLATPEWAGKFDWNKTLIFFGDERAVKPDDALSNYRMAGEAFLDSIPIPQENVFRMRGEATDLEAAASEYESEILERTGTLDVVLLGLGPDGHTASLFPNSPQLAEQSKTVVATPVASLDPHVRRLTLTYKALNTAREVIFLVTGSGKAEVVQEILQGPADPLRLPAQAVACPQTTWFLDTPAAANLT